MDAETRRNHILEVLNQENTPISASKLAARFKVSRQIVVGDIALLRAKGHQIVATPRGYVVAGKKSGIIKKIACRHTTEEMKSELYTIVDLGCTIVDVVVEHPIYGELTGSLNLNNRYDVDQFIFQCEQYDAAPLSLLTQGIHLHTLRCPTEEAYQRVLAELKRQKILISES